MAASNKKRKKLARELQAETGLRYTDALERVRLRTTKEEGMQVAQNSPLLRAIQKQKSKLALEAPEAEALRPKVDEAVRAVLAVLAELPVRDGMRGISGYEDDENPFHGGLHQVGQLGEVQIVLGHSHRMGKTGDDRMQLWLNGPMSMPMQSLPKTVAVSIEGSIEDPSSWVPDLQDLGLHSLRSALQICGWLTGPETAASELAAQEVFGDDELPPEELVPIRTRRLARIERKRRSLLSQIEEDLVLGVAQVGPSAEVVLEKEVYKEMTPEASSAYGKVSWTGEIVLDSDDFESLLVTRIEVGDEIVEVGGSEGGGLSAACFRRDMEPTVRFRKREVPEGGKIRVWVKNTSSGPHVVGGSVRMRPSSLAFGLDPVERQVGAAVLAGDLDLG